MNTFNSLNNDLLIGAYQKAIELNLSLAFIKLLLDELKARKINIDS